MILSGEEAIRLVLTFCLAILLFADGVKAGNLESPSNSAKDYSVKGLHHFACLQNDMVRLISVEYAGPNGQPPCSVVYEKTFPEQPSKKVLWRAEHSTSYCELRVREFVEMLRSWNWKCGLFRDVFSASEGAGSPQPRAVKPAEVPAARAQETAQ